MTRLSAPLLILAAALIAAVLAVSCSSGDESAKDDDRRPTTGAACALLDAAQIEAATGEKVELDAELSEGDQCVFTVGDGPAGVTVALLEAPTTAQFDALVTTDAQTQVPADGAGVEGADASLVWTEAIQLEVGLARKGGAAVKVTWVQSVPDPDAGPMIEMLTAAVGELPEEPFQDEVAAGQATCDALPVEELRSALELPELDASPIGVATACVLADGSGINLSVELPEGAAGPEQLDVDGRVSTVDGKDIEWVIEPVSELGTAAVWTLDPTSERSGELLVLFGDQLVRVSSSANEPGPEIKERAITTARLVGEAGG